MINQQTVELILEEVSDLEREYQQCQGLILTEDDLKCHLFARIKNKVCMRGKSIDQDTHGSVLHSEVKFFDEDDNLTIIPDLCLIDPAHTSIYHSVEFIVKRNSAKFKRYSSKSFEVGGSAILIELKFCRVQSGIPDADIATYRNDLEKIKRLNDIIRHRSQGRESIIGIFVLFNKTNLEKTKFDALKNQYASTQNLHIIYGTGNVNFTGKNPNRFPTGYGTEDMNIC